MKKAFQEKFFDSEILEGHYYDYINDDDSDADWKEYAQIVISEALKREPECFSNMECPEEVPEDICRVCFAWWGDMGWVDNSFGYLFDGYTVMEVLKHCEHGEIVVRSGLQNLHW